jgi:PAS domain S-box-containing protein
MAKGESERLSSEANVPALDRREQRELALLRCFMVTSHDAIVLFDSDGVVQRLNPIAQRLYGRPGAAAEGYSVDQLFTLDSAQKLRARIRELADGHTADITLTHMRSDGATFSLPSSLCSLQGSLALVVAHVDRDDTVVCSWQLRCAERVGRTGSWDWRIDTNHVTWSDELRRIYGVDQDFIPSFEHYAELVHPDDRERVVARIKRAAETRGAFEHDERIVRADGDVRVLRTFGTYLVDSLGGRAMVGTCRDVTDERVREERLRLSEDVFRNVFDNAGSGIVIANGERKILNANPAILAFVGATAAEVVNTSIENWIWEEDRSEARLALDRLLASVSTVERLEIRARHRDGTPRWADVTLSVHAAHGKPSRLIVQLRDASRLALREDLLRREAFVLEDRVEQRTRELAVANAELEAFTYSVSHDLRAPLRSMSGFAQALVEDCGSELGPEPREYLSRIRHAAQHMGQLIDDLLMLSRVTRAEMRRSRVELSDLAKGTMERLRATHPNRIVDVSIEPDLVVEGDPALLRVLLENLLGNAWKFTSTRLHGHIAFGASMTPNGAVFFVRDDGVGFDMAFVQRLFTAFRRLHSDAEFEGTGIGLATVRRIVQRHGGDVWAEGEVDRGATIRFTIPTP